MTDLEKFKLSSRLVQSLEAMGVKDLTPIQKSAWEIMTQPEGDVIIHSETGSGKTLCYLLPLVHQMIAEAVSNPIKRGDGTMLLILVPARELALQVYNVCQTLLRYLPYIVPGSVVGGEDRSREKARLRKGIQVLVATPGRLLDHIRQTGSFVMNQLRYLVIDEADRVLDEGFENDVKELKAVLDDRHIVLRKRILASATINPKVTNLAHFMLKDPTTVRSTDEDGTERQEIVAEASGDVFSLPASVKQQYMICTCKMRLVTLLAMMSWSTTTTRKLMVFVNTADSVEFLYLVCSRTKSPYVAGNEAFIDFPLFKLHGNMTQVDRTSIYSTFRNAEKGILFCTDVAARGIDVPDVDLVVHFDPPVDEKCYVHRTGRTARLGREGTSILFMMPHEVRLIDYYTSMGVVMQKRAPAVMLYHLIKLSKTETDMWDCAHKLQVAVQNLAHEDEEVNDVARKAFMAWRSGYSTYPRHMREYFDASQLHLGYVARSFGLNAPPSEITRSVVGQKKAEMQEQRIEEKKRTARAVPTHAREMFKDEFSFGDTRPDVRDDDDDEDGKKKKKRKLII